MDLDAVDARIGNNARQQTTPQFQESAARLAQTVKARAQILASSAKDSPWAVPGGVFVASLAVLVAIRPQFVSRIERDEQGSERRVINIGKALSISVFLAAIVAVCSTGTVRDALNRAIPE